MKYLNIDYIKAHSRICCDCEDGVLERLGTSAEQVMFELCGRTYEDFVEKYGQVPAPVVHATLELVENFYQHRGPVEPTSLSLVPYNFDLLVKPYIKL
jgi:hypothetical protein